MESARAEAIDRALMSRYWEIIIYPSDPCPPTLVALLTERLPHISPESWPARFSWGGVFVNGQDTRHDVPLPLPCRVEYYEPRFDFENPYSFFPPFETRYVVFEDDDVLIVHKPPRLPAMPAREQTQYCLKVYADRYVGHPVHMPSRLDMSTAGVVVMSKNPRYHDVLQRAFQARRVKKYYLFETASPVTFTACTVDRPIDRDRTHPVLRTVVSEGGKPAATHFTSRCVSSWSDAEGTHATTLVEAQPLTGRTHQIRVHALSLGVPLLGDRFYMGAPAEELHLLSFQIEFPHPRLGTPVSVRLRDDLIPAWALPALAAKQ